MSGALEESYMPAGDDLVCHECFGDSFLKEKIKANGSRGKCAYCGRVDRIAAVNGIGVSVFAATSVFKMWPLPV